jgi:hypothetical protein
MTAIEIQNPRPRRAGLRPLYFALPVAAVLGLAIVAYGQRSSTESPGRAGGPPSTAVDRLTPARTQLPDYPAPSVLEAQAAAVPAEVRAQHYFGYDPVAKHPMGWKMPEHEYTKAFPLFQWDGTALIGFWINNGPRIITPAEYADPNFDADQLFPEPARSHRLQQRQQIEHMGPK